MSTGTTGARPVLDRGAVLMGTGVLASSVADVSGNVLRTILLGAGVIAAAVLGFVVLMVLVGLVVDHSAGIVGGVVCGGLGALGFGAVFDSLAMAVLGAVVGVVVAMSWAAVASRRARRSPDGVRRRRRREPQVYEGGVYDRW